jgi:hypothetical protein
MVGSRRMRDWKRVGWVMLRWMLGFDQLVWGGIRLGKVGFRC